MIHGTKDEYVETIDQRYPILVTDFDKGVFVHFLALAPVGMSLIDARAAVTSAFGEARDAGDDWDYGDVRDSLVEAGFRCVSVAVWEEGSDG